MPYFSIIMPTKNRASLLPKVIQSIIDQTFNDWELIVVDDHGEDNTKEIIEKINDPKIKYFYLKEDHGPGLARDFGIKHSNAEIVVLADSDDVNYPDRLQLTYNAFEKNFNLDVVYGVAVRLEMDDSQFARPSHIFDPMLLRCYNFISNPTIAFRKTKYLETSGYDKKLWTSEDYDLWLSFLEKDAKFLFINEPFVLQKIHPESTTLSLQLEKRKENLAYTRRKHHLETPKFDDVKKLVQNKDLLKFISTPGAIDFWFS